jgi:hypothetical protein
VALVENVPMEDSCAALKSEAFVWIQGDFDAPNEAFDIARALIERRSAEDGPVSLSVIGDFVVPPAEGQESRDFQTLHFDFGLPLDPKVQHDVARYTALHMPRRVQRPLAITRLVPLARLLGQRRWQGPSELIGRLIAYGRTHGAWDDARGYVEGSLARLIEAASGTEPVLPSVKVDTDFLCGLEFDGAASELEFFGRHGLAVEAVEIEVALRPGDLLVFDNLALAHGRRGTRRPGELRQRVFGHPGLSPVAQLDVRDRVLEAFRDAEGV